MRLSGSMRDMPEVPKSNADLAANKEVRAGIDGMSLLVSYLEVMDVTDKVNFDLSLA